MCFGRQLEAPPAGRGRVACEEMLDERWQICTAVAQRRNADADDVEPIVEILPEAFLPDGGGKILVRRGDEARVGF